MEYFKLIDYYLIDYFDCLIDYLTSNNQQIIQIMHLLFDDSRYLIYLIII